MIWSTLVAASLGIALVHVTMGWRLRSPEFWWAAAMALASAVVAGAELSVAFAADLSVMISSMRVAENAVGVTLVAMVWFIHVRLGTGRRWLPVAVTVLWTVAVAVGLGSATGLTFLEITDIRHIVTPWGETVSLPLGTTNPMRFLADAASVLITVYAFLSFRSAWLAGRRHTAVVVGGSATAFIVVAGIHTPLVDAGVVQTPYMISVAFLIILVALSWDIVRDASQARASGVELAETRAEFDRLLRANLLGEFASALAHELNQPLTAVLTNAQVARRYLTSDPPRAEETVDLLDRIIGDDKRAAGIIGQLHGLLARVEGAREHVDVNDMVRETVALCRPAALEKGVTIVLDLDPGVPAVWSNRIDLQQVVLNLLHNALRALGEVSTGGRAVTLETRTETVGVLLAVVDTGPGLSSDASDDLFTPFRRAGPGGIGIGLSICRRIVEAHGGTIHAEDLAGAGARFVVVLPPGNEQERVAHG